MLCVDILADSSNCGGCDIACDVAESCDDGACVPTSTQQDAGTAIKCVYPLQSCQSGPESYCSDFSQDLSNCGGCFQACTDEYSCVAGVCTPPATDGGVSLPDAGFECVGGTSMCDGTYCADFMTDNSNCGNCHLACTTQESCMQGECFLIAP